MPAHVEYQLLAKIVEDGNLKTVLREKIDPSKFGIPETRAAFDFIVGYYQERDTRNLVPSMDKLLDFMPTLELPRVSDRTTLESLCGEVRNDWIRRKLEMAATSAFDLYKQDPGGAVDRLIQDCKLLQVTAHKSKDLDYADSAADAWEEYQRVKSAKGVTGIPFPMGWGRHDENGKPKILKKTGRQEHPLNDQTQGIQSEDLILLYGRPKCIVQGERVLSSTGNRIAIQEACGKIAGLNGHYIGWAECGNSFSGERNCIRITTRSGHEVSVGEDHPMMVPSTEFVEAGKLQIGDYVGVARRIPEPEEPVEFEEGTALRLGMLVGAGNAHLDQNEKRRIECGTIGNGSGDEILNLLQDVGCHGQLSRKVPEIIYSCSNDVVAKFLSGYTDTNSIVSNSLISWSTVSRELAIGVKHLLLRFGVTALLRQVPTNFGMGAWYLSVYSQEQHRILDAVLSLSSKHKAERLRRLATKKIKARRHDDGIPYSNLLMRTILEAKGDKPWKHLWSGFSIGKLFRRTGRISRHLLRKLADHLDAPELLEWADSDIRWEPIETIEDIGRQKCQDITMRDPQNPVFLVENFVTHNSMKTWVLVDMINECYFHYNYRTLVFSKEMPPEQLRKRIVARMLGLDYKLYTQGQLSDEQEEEFYDTVMNLKDEEMRFREQGINRGMLITSGWEEGSWFTGLASVQQKIEEFEPDICFLDAAYLLDDDVTSNQAVWQTILKLAYGLKKMCSYNGIPIVATTQANRKGEETKGSTMSEIAYGDAFAQACDLAIRIIKREDEDGGVLLSMVIAGAREIKMAGFELEAAPASKFRLAQVYESQRQIMAVFKAEAQMIAIEEERAAKQVTREDTRRQLDFDRPDPSAGDGCE
ncbi:MAG: hypothetical protein KAY24_20025 [Candidatus Eisenbacteria sp.]|nr:hypothetical protein [Candidatus Eisenbacteria bacterium]